MHLRQGVQAEVLLSLALVMVTGTMLLAAVFLEINHARIESLHAVLGEGFASKARNSRFDVAPIEGGSWWHVDEGGHVSGVNAAADKIDSGTLALAAEAMSLGESLVESRAPWDPIRFASPDRRARRALVGRIEAPASGLVLIGLILVNVLVFCLFGVSLLRRRVVGPLHRLSRAVREIGDGGLKRVVPVEGVGEIESLGAAFNEMQSALAARTGALEKAVSELRSANANLLQARDGLDRAERLAMVGSLAAGVAHEVGNPMGALLAFLDVASRDSGLGEEGRRCLGRASEQAERVRVILRQLLDFSRPPQIERRPIQMEEVAQQVIELVAAQQEFADIEFEVHVADNVGCALGDSSIVSQILLNLALNAAFAMKGQAKQAIRFEVSSCVRQRRESDGEGPVGSTLRSDSILCSVDDSGPGVSAHDSERIFDPFFTTKAPGEGTGLGLANARRLAQEMGGSIELDSTHSELGGARFNFLLGSASQQNLDDRSAVRAEDRV